MARGKMIKGRRGLKPNPALKAIEKDEPSPNRWQKVQKILEIVAEAGSIVMGLRDTPKLRDFIAAGMRSFSLVMKVRNEIKGATKRQDYFSDSGGSYSWTHGITARLLTMCATGAHNVEDYWDGQEESSRPVKAKIGEYDIWWNGSGKKALESNDSSVAVRMCDLKEILPALGEELFKKFGSRHLLLSQGELAVNDISASEGFVPTKQLLELRDRMKAFYDAGLSRGLMMTGHPGTGKSMGARYLARELGKSSLRISLDMLVDRNTYHATDEISIDIYTAMGCFNPDVLIIDDVDRTDPNTASNLLRVFEEAMSTCKLVIVSINCEQSMLGAAIRPGRIDDIVEVGLPEREVVEKILGENADLAGELDGLHLAYVADFARRIKALGRERAVMELDNLKAHAKKVTSMTTREGRLYGFSDVG